MGYDIMDWVDNEMDREDDERNERYLRQFNRMPSISGTLDDWNPRSNDRVESGARRISRAPIRGPVHATM